MRLRRQLRAESLSDGKQAVALAAEGAVFPEGRMARLDQARSRGEVRGHRRDDGRALPARIAAIAGHLNGTAHE